ncbi:SusD/RagB family nutrient-binding outer membrane lipoprotein [Abyssalbus ytuae]|uniref:SusD/RagB family nutrient-binding outer membrane lipoprotein n=1 Tax=Abyssalbus ytuae TaxID=2926907 RepID=A0A9E7CUJ4_9FLAO|nr:SusD/RagB family nutrient-binding outer membrane lipoprotein [Abyssalbus ytuae]UOB18537.1 SusD/RagB family nutrient-binding outer membrane lipoprotein [Abyssalbus ytuae]
MKSYIAIIFVIILSTSCSDLVEGINDDPNNVTQSSFGNVLTGAEVGNTLFQSGESSRRAAIFAGQYTGIDRQHLGFTTYSVISSDFDGVWSDSYVNALRNTIVAEEVANDENLEGISKGITLVLQAHVFGSLASLYGDIPFDEAGNFLISDPVFEDQIEVYAKIQKQLDEAIELLNSEIDRPEAGADIYFNGNPDKWIEAANTLKARFYMHTKNYQKAYDAAGRGISSIDNSMYSPHKDSDDAGNLNYQFFIGRGETDVVVSDFMVSLLNPGASNPIAANYRGNTKTDETGRYNYLFVTNTAGVQPNTTNGFAAQTAPAPLVTYEENLLILAEAGFRVGGFDTGLDNLNRFRAFMATGGYLTNADPAQITYEPYEASDFEAGGMENPDSISRENALLREILEERYVTLFGQIETFNDTRRTENETVVRVPVMPNTGDLLPQRFLYAQSEINSNNNVPDPLPEFFEKTPVNE